MKFINLTPHNIEIEGLGSFPPSGKVARVRATEKETKFDGLLCVQKGPFVEVENLPGPKDGVIYIVSGFVREALGEMRPDVVAPDTGPTAQRNKKGQISFVRRLVVANCEPPICKKEVECKRVGERSPLCWLCNKR